MYKILLIEDEPLIQKSLKKLLEKRGVEVVVESRGREAIQLILNQKFDRIICDLMLQDISGFDVIEEAKGRFTGNQRGKLRRLNNEWQHLRKQLSPLTLT